MKRYMKSSSTCLCLLATLIFAGCDKDVNKVAKVNLESITVAPSSVSLLVGATQQLTADIVPAGADVALEWQADNPTVASVTGEGLVTAKKQGNTLIWARGGGVETSVPVEVSEIPIPLQDFTVEPETMTLKTGESTTIIVHLVPENANTYTLAFESSNAAVATVSETGTITATGFGNAVITATSAGIVRTVSVDVIIHAIAVTPAVVMLENVGETQQLVAATVPENVTGVTFTFESDNESVATVSNTGLVKAIAPGSTFITINGGGISKQIAVLFNDPDFMGKEFWTVSGTSVADNESDYENVIDGIRTTYWHSEYRTSNPLPQWLIVDMGAPRYLDGFMLYNRLGRNNISRPKHIVFEISNDNVNWETALDIAELPDVLYEQVLPLPALKKARYFKVIVYSVWSTAGYTYIGGIDVYVGEPPAPNPAIGSIPKTEWTVQVSSVFADLIGSNLIDGNIDKAWHSAVGDGQPWAVIDFRDVKTVSAILFTGRQGVEEDTHSSPRHIIFSISDNAEDWETVLDIPELPNVRTTQTLNVPAPKTGRYLKIDVQSTHSALTYSYIGEIDIVSN